MQPADTHVRGLGVVENSLSASQQRAAASRVTGSPGLTPVLHPLEEAQEPDHPVQGRSTPGGSA